MSNSDLQQVKSALLDAGIEVYRTRDAEIQIAERVRLHLMDSGVRILDDDGLGVEFTARSQRSDFPNVSPDKLFERVRDMVGRAALDRGYVETQARSVDVTDPVDADKILDVWHEVTYRKVTSSTEDLIDEVRWALSVEKYVSG